MESSRTRGKWQAPRVAERYATTRWRSAAKRERDPRLVDSLLRAHLPARDGNLLLDTPCGTGRLRETLARHGRYVGLDVAAAMLAVARRTSGAPLLAGDVEHLPFASATFDAVVCCRFLHHLAERDALERVLAELVRVSRGLVIASFWDAGALPEWSAKLVPPARAPRRHARPRAELAAGLERAGADVIGWKHSLRFVSRQAFVVARKRT